MGRRRDYIATRHRQAPGRWCSVDLHASIFAANAANAANAAERLCCGVEFDNAVVKTELALPDSVFSRWHIKFSGNPGRVRFDACLIG